MIDSWIKSARVSLDELEWEIEHVRNARVELSVQVNDLEKEVKRLREEVALYRQGVIDGMLMYPDIYNYLPLYLRELIE